MRFTFHLLDDNPIFSVAPCSTRMTATYRDRAGSYHLFTDFVDPQRETPFDNKLDSWDADIRYYSSPDLKAFTDQGVVVGKGRWSGDADSSDLDCVGVASPGVTVADDQVLLFYAGRGPVDPAGPFEATKNLEDLPGQIMLAIAPADADGAPSGPFVKQGPITNYDATWRNIRHDDPCPVATDNEIVVFYKAIGQGEPYDNRVVSIARSRRDKPGGPYTLHPRAVLEAPGGGEVPRAFRVGDAWHMFHMRYHSKGAVRGRVYGHYTASDPTRWTLVNDHLYESHSRKPGQGAGDMCPIWLPFDPGPPKLALGCRLDDGAFGDAGCLKQWLYEIRAS